MVGRGRSAQFSAVAEQPRERKTRTPAVLIRPPKKHWAGALESERGRQSVVRGCLSPSLLCLHCLPTFLPWPLK